LVAFALWGAAGAQMAPLDHAAFCARKRATLRREETAK
jgi:hypothetical protein